MSVKDPDYWGNIDSESGKYYDENGFEYDSLEVYKALMAEWANTRAKCQKLCEIVSKCRNAETITGSLIAVYDGINESIDFTHDQLKTSAEELSPLVESHASDLANNIVECARNVKISKRGANSAISAIGDINTSIGALGEKAIYLHNNIYFPKYEAACGKVNKPVEKFM